MKRTFNFHDKKAESVICKNLEDIWENLFSCKWYDLQAPFVIRTTLVCNLYHPVQYWTP